MHYHVLLSCLCPSSSPSCWGPITKGRFSSPPWIDMSVFCTMTCMVWFVVVIVVHVVIYLTSLFLETTFLFPSFFNTEGDFWGFFSGLTRLRGLFWSLPQIYNFHFERLHPHFCPKVLWLFCNPRSFLVTCLLVYADLQPDLPDQHNIQSFQLIDICWLLCQHCLLLGFLWNVL